MHLSKSDILQALMIGLTLLVSAIAVPMIVSEQNPKYTAENAQEIQQIKPSSTVEAQDLTSIK
jgi:hypothetical protein